jgi:hypothetical protein
LTGLWRIVDCGFQATNKVGILEIALLFKAPLGNKGGVGEVEKGGKTFEAVPGKFLGIYIESVKILVILNLASYMLTSSCFAFIHWGYIMYRFL